MQNQLGNPILIKREKEYNISFNIGGGVKELNVESNSIVKIKLSTNPSISYEWVFVNEDEIKQSNTIELRNDTYNGDNCGEEMAGCGGIRTLEYYIKDATKKLPEIKLEYKKPWEKEVFGKVIVTLKGVISSTTTPVPTPVPTPIPTPVPIPSSTPSSTSNPIPSSTPSPSSYPSENESDSSDITIKANKVLIITLSLLLLIIFH